MSDDLVAFLRARLDEDEAVAKTAAGLQFDPENGWGTDGRAITPHIAVVHEAEARAHIAHHDPARVLREVGAKRAILAEHERQTTAQIRYVLFLLTAVYSGHPDYRDEWKP